MKRKVVVVGSEAQERVLKGAHFAVNAVKLTIGPFGRNFASGLRGGPVAISNDGVSLLREIEGLDEIQDLGVRAVREAASKTNEKVGDGTTGAAVLTGAILDVLCIADSAMATQALAPVETIEKVRAEKAEIIDMLKKSAQPIETLEDLINVARVSGEYPELAKLIGEAQWKVGRYGTVLSEEANSEEDSVEYIHGIKLDAGYNSSRIINNQERQSLELEDVHILITNNHFRGNFIPSLKHIWDHLASKGFRNVVILGASFDDDAIGVCVKNIQEGSLKLFPINAPYVERDEIMEDIAAAIGGKYINVSERNIETMVPGDVGHASKVVAKRFEGIIAGYPAGHDVSTDNRIDERIQHIETKMGGDVSPFERRRLEARLSQLKAGTAIIKVGAETEQERRHKKDKVDDAVNAVKYAYQEGVVPGAGQALANIADSLPDDYLLKKALYAPLNQIKMLAPKNFVIEDWVKDPVKVVYTALSNACDIAASLATLEIAVNYEREKPQYVTTVDNKIGQHDGDE